MTEVQIQTENLHDMPIHVSDDNIAKVYISIDELEMEPYVKQYIKDKRKNVVLRGFRKGTAPEEMVARAFKAEARQAAKNNLIFIKYTKLLQEHKLQPLSEPKIDHMHDEDGKFIANLIVDVLQPIVLGQYLGLEIQKMPMKSMDSSLKKMLGEIKQTYPKLINVVNGIAENGNVVVADFIVTDGDKELERQSDFRIRLGSNLYFGPFEEQILGMSAGEAKEFNIQFPATYHKEEYRNKDMHFHITIKDIKIIDEYSNEELATLLKYENKEKMLEFLMQEIDTKHKNEEHLFYENQILGQLLSAHLFKLPRKLVEDEIRHIRVDHPDMTAERAEEVAERFTRTDLVLRAIYERHPEIQFKQEEFNAKVTELAIKANDTVEHTIQKLQTAGKLQSFVGYLTNCKVIDFLIEMADKKDVAPSVIEENNVTVWDIEKHKNMIPYDINTIKEWMKGFLGHELHHPINYNHDIKTIECSCGEKLTYSALQEKDNG